MPAWKAIPQDEVLEHGAAASGSRAGGVFGSKFFRQRSIGEAKIESQGKPSKPWRSVTLQARFLTSVILIAGSLICVVHILLVRSQRDGGIIFSSDVNGLPLSQSFGYLYLPTLIAVLYSLMWGWVDLDVKRLEPYFQLSQENGASAADSLLLFYPFDFIATVPMKAVRSRHWPVFVASFGVVLIFWGLTPTQAGLFATETITRSFPVTSVRSTSFLSLSQQETQLDATYAQSVFNIAWLNETLPRFMSRDYMLAPFEVQTGTAALETSELWTGRTMLYSVNVTCEAAIRTETPSYVSSNGCDYFIPITLTDGKETEFATLYVGYHNEAGFAHYYLSTDCPVEANHTFLLRWSRGSDDENYPLEETTLYCEPTYYQQEVMATVRPPQMSVVNTSALAPPSPLPQEMFNTSDFEWGMGSGRQKFAVRGDYPVYGWPDHKSRVKDMNLNLNYLQDMAAFAIAAYQRPAEDYMNPELLQSSYQAAYRLLFSRRFVNVLGTEPDPATATQGERRFTTQAVVVVPTFAYLVEGLLGAVLLLASALLFMCWRRPSKLSSDPSSIASVMSLVADNANLLKELSPYDKHSNAELEQSLSGRRYRLADQGQDGYQLQSCAVDLPNNATSQSSTTNKAYRGERPVEFRLWVGLTFLGFQVAIFILLAVLYVMAKRDNGLTIPSSNRFVRQLVQSYIPTAIATLMEPMWVVLNRLLCMLQPLETLRKGHATAKKSITMNYMSLPPQFFIFRALRSRDFLLAMVCLMALLGNALAIAFSSLFFEAPFAAPRPVTSLSTAGLPLDNSLFNANTSARSEYDPFYVAMSNVTAKTPMPRFTDERYFYLPFNLSTDSSLTGDQQAKTPAIGGQLDCVEASPESDYTVDLIMDEHGRGANFSFQFAGDEQKPACDVVIPKEFLGEIDPNGILALELTIMNMSATEERTPCQEYIVTGWLRADVSFEEGESVRDGVATFHSLESTFLVCHSRVVTGMSEVRVDASGTVQTASALSETDMPTEPWFTTSAPDFISRVNTWLGSTPEDMWHNDSFPSDFYNYLMRESMQSDRLLDPSLPVPSAADAAPAFSELYSKLFSIAMGTNADGILTPLQTPQTVQGVVLGPTTRVYMSKPMFILAEVILALYIMVSITLYIRRPWRFMPRLPTSLASNIASVAASRAVLDLRGTAGLSTASLREYVERLGRRYGYGQFTGTDGLPKVGIEREPFLVQRSREVSVGRKAGAEDGSEELVGLASRETTAGM